MYTKALAVAYATAKHVGDSFPLVDWEDIYQELCVWVMHNTELALEVEESDLAAEVLDTALLGVARKYARSESKRRAELTRDRSTGDG